MEKNAPSREADKVMLRLPDGMRPWIAEQAKKNFRSSNGQIVWMLQQMMDQIRAGSSRAEA